MKFPISSVCALFVLAIAASSHALLKFPAMGSRRVSRDTDVASARSYFPLSSPSSGTGASPYFPNFRKFVGFQPVFAESRVENPIVDTNGVPGKSESSARLFGLFNPFNPLNPFANLVALPTNANGLNILQLKGKERIIARADVFRNVPAPAAGQAAGPNNMLGSVLFFQESALKPIVAVASGTSLAVALTNARLEIRASPRGADQTTQCSAATVGAVYNPTGVTDGGVLSTTLSTTVAGNNLYRAFINNIPATRATLFSPNSIISHSIRITPGGANDDRDALCGTITFVA